MCKRAYIYSMQASDIQDVADLLKALGEFNRLSLVYQLCQCQTPQNVMCLCDCCDVDTSVVSRHLKVLSQEGVVQVEKQGRKRAYSLNRSYVAERLRELADKIEASEDIGHE
jgi:ArsR family transcriptional regulator, arsenate/arsenite/antimonite-responsive transcriptional repressor